MATRSTGRSKSTPKKTARSGSASKKSAKKASTKKTAATKSAKPAKKAGSSSAKPSKKKTASAAGRSRAASGSTGTARRKTSARRKSAPRPVRPKSVEKKFKHLGEMLLKKQAELMQAYAVAKTDTRDRMDDGTEDYIDYAVNSYAKDFMLSLTELERQQLQLVREALFRLDRGEYGDCLQCGVEIPMKRLEVAPWVRYCIACQELEDQGLLPQQPFSGFEEDEEIEDEDAAEGEVVDDDDDDEDEESDDGDAEPLGEDLDDDDDDNDDED